MFISVVKKQVFCRYIVCEIAFLTPIFSSVLGYCHLKTYTLQNTIFYAYSYLYTGNFTISTEKVVNHIVYLSKTLLRGQTVPQK